MCELLWYIKNEQELTHWALEHAASKEAYIDKVISGYGNDAETISEFNMWYNHMRIKFDDRFEIVADGNSYFAYIANVYIGPLSSEPVS